MDYQIVATLGPSSDTTTTWQGMLASGVTAFRLNTSHLSMHQLEDWMGRLDSFLAPTDPRPPVVLDLQGSKWRLGQFQVCGLSAGERVTLVCAASADGQNVLPVPHPDFFRAASMSSGEIVLDDAKRRLQIESCEEGRLIARVTQGGEFMPRKGITYTASTYRQECLNDMDRLVLGQTRHVSGIRFALSYVKDAVEMASYRRQIGRSAYLIAKLERQPALDEAMPIAQCADELWLCRGDLGAELGAKAMAMSAYRFSEQVHGMPVPVLLAGQVFEHLAQHSAPTRAELCSAYDMLMRGYRGLVLSDETAIGRDPIAACRTAALFRT